MLPDRQGATSACVEKMADVLPPKTPKIGMNMKKFALDQPSICPTTKLGHAVAVPKGAWGYLPQKYFLALPVCPQTISNTLKLAQIWQFQDKEANFCTLCVHLKKNCCLKYFLASVPLPPPPKKNKTKQNKT